MPHRRATSTLQQCRCGGGAQRQRNEWSVRLDRRKADAVDEDAGDVSGRKAAGKTRFSIKGVKNQSPKMPHGKKKSIQTPPSTIYDLNSEIRIKNSNNILRANLQVQTVLGPLVAAPGPTMLGGGTPVDVVCMDAAVDVAK